MFYIFYPALDMNPRVQYWLTALVIFLAIVAGYEYYRANVAEAPEDTTVTSTSGDTTSSSSTGSSGTTANSDQTSCPSNFSPVCGADGITYANQCRAEEKRVAIASVGMCPDKAPSSTATSATSAASSGHTGSVTSSSSKTTSATTSTASSDRSSSVSSYTSSTHSVGGFAPTKDVNVFVPPAGNGRLYYNESFGYGFRMPENAYYKGLGAREGAAHSVGVRIGTGVDDATDADVIVLYYPGLTTSGSTQNGQTVIPLDHGGVVVETV